jgi:hypothetical protein
MPSVLPRGRWSLLAAAALATVMVAGALGARFDWLLPTPTVDPSRPPSSLLPPTLAPTPDASLPVVALDSPVPTTEATPAPTPKPTPTKKPKPTPTPKPEPTAAPIGPMSLALKACPGGVVIDWTKPSPAVSKYHVLRNVGGDVPPTYPSGGTDVETATTWSAGTTDGFDASLGGGVSATYRAFAFDADGHVLQYSPSRSVTTVDRIDLGSLGMVDNGPGTGSLTFSWAAPGVAGGCFSYGKLVGSTEDPDPSYLTGAEPLAVVGDQSTTEATVERTSGTTMWVRYEVVRATSTGKFIVARTDVVQVTFP